MLITEWLSPQSPEEGLKLREAGVGFLLLDSTCFFYSTGTHSQVHLSGGWSSNKPTVETPHLLSFCFRRPEIGRRHLVPSVCVCVRVCIAKGG